MSAAPTPPVGDTITDPIDLERLPVGSVVLGRDGRAYDYQGYDMWHRSERLGGTVGEYVVPALVLYVPGEESRPDIERLRGDAAHWEAEYDDASRRYDEIREQVAQEIEAERDRHRPNSLLLRGAASAYTTAARIARGGTR